MKYTVRVANKCYEVEIEDIYARPVIARVDSRAFEVNLEDGIKPALQKEAMELEQVPPSKQPSSPVPGTDQLTAPLPGTIIEVFVKADEHIESGQIVLIIEAMKMKNTIRSTRAGQIAEVLVSAGETVAHKQALVKFAD